MILKLSHSLDLTTLGLKCGEENVEILFAFIHMGLLLKGTWFRITVGSYNLVAHREYESEFENIYYER